MALFFRDQFSLRPTSSRATVPEVGQVQVQILVLESL